LLLSAFLATQALGWYIAHRQPAVSSTGEAAGKAATPEARLKELETAGDGLARKLAALAPKGQYVVIDTANNRVVLRNGQQTLRDMIASCGTGNVLEDPVSGRTWTFETPRGEFKVQSKKANPVWIKPDWAFVEDGEPIPRNVADRAKPGEMGDYAIGIGDGYYIHGTLYKRLLGRNVSHGCVRLGDEDIKFLFNTVKYGTRVIIY
jgi:L,D-transpeptidase YbiS